MMELESGAALQEVEEEEEEEEEAMLSVNVMRHKNKRNVKLV
jgi:hypothetical protein